MATGANAAIVNFNYAQGQHIQTWVAGGSNGAAFNPVWGDGANYGVSAQNKCVDGSTVTCASLGFVNGNNGLYQTTVNGAPNPKADYTGSLQYDDAVTFTYTDQETGVTGTWYAVTGGTLAWAGSYGLEVTVAPGASGNIGGSFFQYSFANGNVNLTTGVRTATSKCDLGIAGNAIVGALLCGVANPAGTYAYANVGTTYTKPVNWTGVQVNADGSINLLMYSNRFSATGSGNNLQEILVLRETIPVPAAVWMFGSGLVLLGGLRRRMKAA
ncbi:MAG: hypothetical protein JNK40_00610 [Chromatiales bacterium]|nr:hypothetical protein [Chromatiales bacterium]